MATADVLQISLGLAISILLLYVALVMRQFEKSVERLERVTEALRASMEENGDRLARLETRMESRAISA